jgi:uncharacterized protein (DUF427 family)
MADPRMKIPSPVHPITIARSGSRVIVRLAGEVIADTANALTLREASYPPVYYIPREDIVMAHLERSPTASYCPYKGEASYYSGRIDGRELADVAWSYETPYPSVAEIAGHLAFYPDRVDAIEEIEAANSD